MGMGMAAGHAISNALSDNKAAPIPPAPPAPESNEPKKSPGRQMLDSVLAPTVAQAHPGAFFIPLKLTYLIKTIY